METNTRIKPPRLNKRRRVVFFKKPTRISSVDKPHRIPVKPILTRSFSMYHQPVAELTDKDLEKHLALANELKMEADIPKKFNDKVKQRDLRNAMFGSLAQSC